MLDAIGVASLDELIAQTVPASIRMQGALTSMGNALSEVDALARLRALAVVPGPASSALRDFLADPLRDPVGAEGGVAGSSRFSLEAP